MKRILLLRTVLVLLAWLCGIGNIQAQEAYARISGTDGEVVLTIFYDNLKEVRTGAIEVDPSNLRPSLSAYELRQVTIVAIDASVADYPLANTTGLFEGFTKLTHIVGLSNLNMENVTDVSRMFRNCASLKVIDLCGCKIGSIDSGYINAAYMFAGCSSLKTIYKDGSEQFFGLSTSMFDGCVNLVGYYGLDWETSYPDQTYLDFFFTSRNDYWNYYTTIDSEQDAISYYFTDVNIPKPNTFASTKMVTSINWNGKGINDLTGIIGWYPILYQFSCSNNNIHALDLTYINVNRNTGEVLSPALNYCSVSDNALSAINVSKCTNLKGLACSNNHLTSLNVSQNKALTSLSCDNNELVSLDVSQNGDLEMLSCARNFYLFSIDVSANSQLMSLYCEYINTASLDVSHNTELENLHCSHNHIDVLDLSKNTKLSSFDCADNKLTSLDLSHNTELKYLYCYSNQLTSLDLSKNAKLNYLACNGNQLTSLLVSDNSVLKSLYCYDNQIQGEAMDALIGSLPVVESGSFYVFHEGSEEEGNVCTKKQVEAANQKGWKVYKKTSGGYELYAGEDDVLQVENIEFADAKVKAICIENWDKNNDGELSKAEAAAVTDLKSAFVNKTDIRSFEEFKYFTGYKGEAYRSAFNGCTNLTRITLPESMEIIPMEAFAECSSLSQIEIPANVKEIYGGAFTNCASLTSISLPLGLKEIDISLFFGCSKLTTINIPNSVEVIKLRAFSHCDGLQTFEIPEGVQKLDQCIFENCTNLKAITIPKSVTSIANNVVHGCQVLTSVTSLIENPFEIEEGTFYTDWGTPPTATLYVPVGTKTKYQATTGWNQFAKIREIGEDDDLAVGDLFTEQTIEGVTMTFMVTSLDPMECQVGDGTQACIDKATTGDVTVPAMPRGFVTRRLGDYGFAGCSKVEHFWMNDSIWYIGAHAFDGCLTARSVDLPRYVREVAHDFVDHEMEIHVPATASQSVIEAVAQACERTGSTVSVSKPEEAALERVFIWRQVRGIDEHAFGNMPSVKEMVVDAENPYFDSRGNCHAILRTEDNTLLFGCQNTFIPETVTAIAAYAFEGHNKLKGITIPAAVKSIGEAAFIHCDKMTLVKSLIVHPFAIADNTFDDAVYQTAKLLVPFGTKELYASTDGWKNFFNIEEMEMKELAQGGTIVNGGNGGSIDEGTALDGNVIGDVYYNIGSENGGYNANEGCITVTKPTADEQVDALEGQDIFGEDMKNNFTGIVFKVPAGKGTIRVTAKTTGSMVLKVKIGNAAPMEIELEGKLKATFPYEVATPSYVYIYAGQTAAGVKAQSGAVADGLGELKIYDIELSTGEDGIDEMTNDGLRMTDTIYSISGQRLSKPQRGVNIINGKKVLIK